MPTEQQYGSKPVIEIDGTALSSAAEELLEETRVENSRHLPDMFALTLRNDGADALEQSGLRLGARVQISSTACGDGAQQPLIVGEITAVEVEYDRSGSHAVARGYDLSHRLIRGRSTRAYSQVTDEDIARQIADAHGVEMGEVDIDSVVYEHVSQINSTDWEFLRSRATEGGYEVSVDDGKLSLRRPQASADGPDTGDVQTDDPLQLTRGNNLEAFRARLTAAQQVTEVEVRSWDPAGKREIVATAPGRTRTVEVTTTPSDLAGLFDAQPRYVVHDRPVVSQAEADTAAAAVAEHIASSHAEAFGVTAGNPRLRAGMPVSLGLLGDQHDGKYTLSSTNHVYNETGYKTHFEVTGRQERSLIGLAGSNGHGGGSGRPLYGVVSALVTDVDDPEQLGRVRLKFPWLDDDYETFWVRMTQFGAGAERGAFFLPEVNDEVLVAFEHGDVRRPFVIGSLHNGQDRPPLVDEAIDGSTGEIVRRGFVSRLGHRLVFDDDSSSASIELSSGDGRVQVVLDQVGAVVKIKSSGAVEIASDTGVKVESSANLELSASGNVSISASGTLDLNGSGGVTIDGATINIG